MTSVTQIANSDSGSATRSKINKMITRVVDVTMAPYNATGDGSTDDTAAIQAAIDWTSDVNRGVIFFPPGTYKTTSALTWNTDAMSIVFQGAGSASTITGNFADYILKRSNTNPTGGVRVVECLAITNTNAAGGGVQMLGCVGGVIQDCAISAYNAIDVSEAADSITVNRVGLSTLPSYPAGSVGIYTAGDRVISSVDIAGFDEGIRAYGTGLFITGCRVERNVTGFYLGKEKNGTLHALQGALIAGNSFEANDTAIYCYSTGSTHITGAIVQGTPGSPAGGSVYGLRVNGASFCTFSSLSLAGGFSTAAVDLAGASITKVTCIGINTANDGTFIWHLPTNTSEIQCISCDNPTLALAVADLPSSPIEGMVFDVTDGTNGLAWGATVTNTGTHTTHYRVRYNGAAWTVMGK